MKNEARQWQSPDLTKTYLEGIRGAIPLAYAQIEVMLNIIAQWRPNPGAVLDLGCGDGVLGRAILDHWPQAHVFFLDFSKPMLDACRRLVPADASTEIRQIDYGTPDWLAALADSPPLDVIVSGFSIHHQPDARKRSLYAELFDALAPGGVFLNLEHVASPTPAVESLFDEHFIDSLHEHHTRGGGADTRAAVAERFYHRSDKVANILAPVETQLTWLREIGFADVDCYFKIFELALFGGRKP